MTVCEGTPEELARFQRELEREERGDAIKRTLAPDTTPVADDKFVSAGVALRVVTRRRLSPEQQSLISTLYGAGEGWTLATILQHKLDYTTSQFAGLMGAFGRRFTQTEGYIEGSWFFDQEWDHEEGCNRYRLPPSVRTAVEQAGLAKPR